MAPQVTFFVRDESGMRVGAVVIGRYDFGRNSLGGTLSWSGAPRPSATNPAGTFDAGPGFGRRLGGNAFLEKLTPHANLVWEKSSGIRRVASLFEGMECELNDRLAIDVSGQHFAFAGGATDHQIVVGLTLTVGGRGRP